MDTLHDSPGTVWKVTFLDGSSCHYGVKSTAQAAARGCGTVEAIELKDKRFRLVEAGSAGKVDLPPLPVPEIGLPWRMNGSDGSVHSSAYSSGQMRDYARAALSTQSTHQPDVSIKAGEIDIPTLPKSLLNLIGEYGMARTDGVNELEIQHRWLSLIDGIKGYARDVLAAKGVE